MIHYTDLTGRLSISSRRFVRGRNGSNADKAEDNKAGDSVRAVDRALDILLAFKPRDDALTVSELLRRIELSRPGGFLTGTAAEVVPVTSLDGRQIGTGKPGPVTRDLLERFRKLTRN